MPDRRAIESIEPAKSPLADEFGSHPRAVLSTAASPAAQARSRAAAGTVGIGANVLRVGGLTALTSVDYPGKLAAVVYCQGCPWRCRYCHNGHLLDDDGTESIPWSDVVSLLASRRGLLDAVVFGGGEPTAQGALAYAMARVRDLGFKIGLHTGGAYPERLDSVLALVDWVGLDIKALPADYSLITGVPGSGERAWQSLGLLLDAGVDLEVRTTPMPGLDSDTYLDRLMRRLAETGVTNYALQQCQTEQALDASLQGRHQALGEDLPVALFERFALRGP